MTIDVFAISTSFGECLVITADTKQQIQGALQSQDFARAARIAETALAHGESHETLYRLAALQRQQEHDFHGAAEMLMHAVQLSPDDPDILVAAADSMRHAGQLEQSVALFDDVLKRDQNMVAAWYGRALALESSGELEAARASYKQVAELSPSMAPGYAGLSTTSAQLGDNTAARRYATQAHELAPNDPAACMALARCDMADGDFAQAVAVLRQTSLDQVDLLTLLGDALDRLGNFDEAFVAYTMANQRFVHSTPPSEVRLRVEEMEAAITSLKPGDWKATPNRQAGKPAQHVFLLGFPRSGTTLVEQVLASLPDVVTLEESPTLGAADDLLTGDGISRLAALPELDADNLRAAYWQCVAARGIEVTGKTFVDMDPSKSAGLPVIACLFPEAKIIIMRRDPRDVVWSCFRRAFARNALTIEFSSLQSAALHYAAIMRLMRACIATLPLDTHTVIYEDLVRDFDTTTRDLCQFLNIPWSPVLRDFGSTARLGRIKTASAAQVRQPLFDGSGQWKNYADKLEPVMPILAPWIDAS